jgi:hypothetical protein
MTDSKKHCESYGHSERVATHKREGMFDKEHTVYMCYDCTVIDENSVMKKLNVQKLKVPGYDN